MNAEIKDTFRRIFATKGWGGIESESASGPGSCLDQTVVIRRELPGLLKETQTKILLDAPCGDYFWLKEVTLELEMYIGVDIVDEIILENHVKYGGTTRQFMISDITCDNLPYADCILCRDCLDHLSFKDIFSALGNFTRLGAKYLLATTYAERLRNTDITTGEWRPLNLRQPPLLFPAPVRLINENCTEEDGRWSDKSLGLWSIEELLAFRSGFCQAVGADQV